MPKGAGPMPGPKPARPQNGKNGPSGTGGGTKHYAPPKPKGGKGQMTGTK